MSKIVSTGQYTIVDANDTPGLLLSNESCVVKTDSFGANADYSQASSTISVLNGLSDDTANWTFSKTDYSYEDRTNTQSFVFANTLAGATASAVLTINPTYLNLVRTAGLADNLKVTFTTPFKGVEYDKVFIKIRRATGAGWSGRCTYINENHTAQNSTYSLTLPQPEELKTIGVWTVLVYDMAQLTSGGNEWLTSQSISDIRFDLTVSTADSFDVEYIAIGKGISSLITGNNLSIVNASSTSAYVDILAKRPGFPDLTKRYSLVKAAPGAAGPAVTILPSGQAFYFEDNVAKPSSQSLTFNLLRQNATGTAVFTTTPTVPLSGTGDSRTLSLSDFGSNSQIVVTATVGTVSDSITIMRVDKPSQSVIDAAANFNTRNDRLTTAVLAPSVSSNQGVSHSMNSDGSCNIALKWDWNGDESTIDGFRVTMRQGTSGVGRPALFQVSNDFFS